MSSQGTAVVAFSQDLPVATRVTISTTVRPKLPRWVKKDVRCVLYRNGVRLGLVQVLDLVKPSSGEFAGVWVSHHLSKGSLEGGMCYFQYVPGSTDPGWRASCDPCPEYDTGCARRSGHIYHLRPRRLWRR